MNRKQSLNFYIESLGCAKNSVDSRAMAALLLDAGYSEINNMEGADVIIVNTCGFIQPARQESLHVLNELAGEKKENQLLIAAGCLSQRDKQLLSDQVNGLDAVLGTRNWPDILQVIEKAKNKAAAPYYHFPPNGYEKWAESKIPLAAVQGGSAYLKIADGCDRACAFCAIPHIKGKMISRKIENVIRDAQMLQDMGVQEIIIIAQDTTSYGRDLGYRDGLAELLQQLVKRIPNVPWLRVMYAFPGEISDELIATMANEPRILPYMDLPLQHAHPNILKCMMRPNNMKAVRECIKKLRDLLPEISLRTTFIVGFPGEGEQEFQELGNFMREIRFDRVGFFPYYHEEFTQAYHFKNLVPVDIVEERIEYLASIQQEISLQKNRSFIGKKMDVLIEGSNRGVSVGRSYRDAPEIDGLVIVKDILPVGKIVTFSITDAYTYDLLAKSNSV